MGISKIYKDSMEVGYYFLNHKIDELIESAKKDENDVEEWYASKHCSTFCKMVLDNKDKQKYLVESFLDVMYMFIDCYEDGKKCFRDIHKMEDHMWDDYCRGFIAGQKFGYPDDDNLELAREAEQIWDNDVERELGYYQEACDIALGIY